MEYSLQQIKKIAQTKALEDAEVRDAYEDIFQHIINAANRGSFSVDLEIDNFDEHQLTALDIIESMGFKVISCVMLTKISW